jgi:hypothetical protein
MAWAGYSLFDRGLDVMWQSAHTHFQNARSKLLKDPDGAEREFRNALALWDSLARACPHTPTHHDAAWDCVAIAHDHLAELQRNAGRFAEAEQSLRAALAIDEKLVSEWPDRPSYRQHLEVHRKRFDWIVSLRTIDGEMVSGGGMRAPGPGGSRRP